MTILETENAPVAIGPYSQAIRVGSMIYTSGQIPLTLEGEIVEGGIVEQTRQVLTNLKAILEDAGSCLNDVVKVSIFLDNMDDFAILNEVYAEFFDEHKPVRSTVAVQTLPKNVLVEMDVVAIARDYMH